MSVYAGPEIVNDNLVFCIDAANPKSYPGSGTTWGNIGNKEGMSNSGDATLVNGPSYSSTNMGVFNFDAVDDYADSTITPSGLTGTGSWTMEAWFKVNGAPQNTLWQNVIIDTDATGSSANMICVDYGGVHGGTQHQLLYTSRPSTGGIYTTITGPTLTVGTWYHALVARNASTDTKLYVNGVLYNTYSGNLPTATQPLVRLGRWTDGTNYANVSISNVKIYNRSLTDFEVQQNFNATRGRFGI